MAFYIPLPKFNLHSYAVENNSQGRLLDPQTEALQSLQKFFAQKLLDPQTKALLCQSLHEFFAQKLLDPQTEALQSLQEFFAQKLLDPQTEALQSLQEFFAQKLLDPQTEAPQSFQEFFAQKPLDPQTQTEVLQSLQEFFTQKLLDPQTEALQSLQEIFAQNPAGRTGIGLISMPTGSGKSGVIICLPYFLGKLGLNPPPKEGDAPQGKPLHRFDKPVLVIAPDVEIANQLEDVLTVLPDAPGENFLLKRGIVPENAKFALPKGVKIQETKHVLNPEYLESNEVIIANAQKFLEANWEDALPDDIFKLVIVDEAHHHPARTWRRIIQKFRDQAMVVFFTATPFRGDGQPVVEDEEGRKVYRLTLEDARDKRIIRRINWNELNLLPTGEADLKAVCQLILQEVKSMQERKDQENPLPDNIPHMAIAIAKNIAYAEEVANMWNGLFCQPGSAIAYHSEVKPKKTKLAMKEAIKTNRVKLVVVVDSLLEGFDHPPISIAAIMTSIGSRVKFAQFIGRAQRIVRGQEGPESEKIRADVVTHSYFQQEENYRAFEREQFIPNN